MRKWRIGEMALDWKKNSKPWMMNPMRLLEDLNSQGENWGIKSEKIEFEWVLWKRNKILRWGK